jgi:uncharacterized protein YndB with AHSA1/START domain
MTLDPIQRQVHVRLDQADAFRLFTTGMGSWWPLETHSRRDEDHDTEAVVFEDHVGGRIYEVMTDGSEGYWGTVTAWDPHARVVFDWKPNDEDHPHTEVEVTFTPDEDGGTIVALEHRNWEVLGPALGAQGREGYGSPSGWTLVFDQRFADAAGRVT